jgi:hypothetical protein
MKYLIPLLILLAACGPDADSHKFNHGQCVEIKLTGEQGMVVYRWNHSPRYSIRVARASKTNSAIFGPDNTENQRYALVRFREFELIDCVQPGQK